MKQSVVPGLRSSQGSDPGKPQGTVRGDPGAWSGGYPTSLPGQVCFRESPKTCLILILLHLETESAAHFCPTMRNRMSESCKYTAGRGQERKPVKRKNLMWCLVSKNTGPATGSRECTTEELKCIVSQLNLFQHYVVMSAYKNQIDRKLQELLKTLKMTKTMKNAFGFLGDRNQPVANNKCCDIFRSALFLLTHEVNPKSISSTVPRSG